MTCIKKTAIAVLILSNSTAFAGSMASENVNSVPTAQWGVGIQGLYLKPSFNGFMGGQNTTFTESENSSTYQSTLISNNPSWRWSFRLEASYYFIKDNDLNLNWYHLGHKKNTDRSSYLDTEESTQYAFSNEPHWDAVNLEFGHQVSFTEQNKIRFHGGAQYTRLKNRHTVPQYTSVTEEDDVLETSNVTKNQEATFTGFGPRIGADMSYHLGKGFAVFANGAAAILAGTSKATFTTTQTTTSTETTTTTNANASIRYNQTVVIPELEGKLGLEYTYPTPPWQSDFECRLFMD
ncbi:Lpg1974 family pore-forming outer membrane protein [Legionella nagasakiensis]|uniref:Lpg1974 family pore-forming outer membrane protein n=1 Tax=Legionella nagasakiensis TaxID=535290 RepID=UPI001056B147|nr:Lpg1974 family pore-forming outer membrane protein [Legionella nagasakiensis]